MFALVTGATGFIGSHLVDELLEQGWRVRVLARESSNMRWLPEDRIEVERGGMNDQESIRRAIDGVDCVFHVAGIYRAPDIESYRKVNVEPVRLLLEALSGRHDGGAPGDGGVAERDGGGGTNADKGGDATGDSSRPQRPFQRFVLVSSFAAAGPSPDGRPLTEDMPVRPVSSYGYSKREAEELTLSYQDQVPVTVVRPPGVYGPRDENFLVIFRSALKGRVPKIGRANRYTNLIYGRDFAKGLILAATRDATKSQVYFMAHEERSGNVELVNDIAKVLHVEVRRLLVPMFFFNVMAVAMIARQRLTGRVGFLNQDRVATMRQRYWLASVEKMKRDLGWSPPTSLLEGLEETARWYKENGWL